MFQQSFERLLSDRSRALRPEAVLLGVNFSAEIQELGALTELALVLGGYLASMEVDGTDDRTHCGVLLVRMRAHLDVIEQCLSRTRYKQDGQIA